MPLLHSVTWIDSKVYFSVVMVVVIMDKNVRIRQLGFVHFTACDDEMSNDLMTMTSHQTHRLISPILVKLPPQFSTFDDHIDSFKYGNHDDCNLKNMNDFENTFPCGCVIHYLSIIKRIFELQQVHTCAAQKRPSPLSQRIMQALLLLVGTNLTYFEFTSISR